jgi:hypothetical protein
VHLVQLLIVDVIIVVWMDWIVMIVIKRRIIFRLLLRGIILGAIILVGVIIVGLVIIVGGIWDVCFVHLKAA